MRWSRLAAAILGSVALSAVALAPTATPARAQDPAELRPVVSARFPDVRWIGTAELARRLSAEPSRRPLLLDVRTREEYAVSHLRAAVRVDPALEDVSTLDLPHDAPIVVYCSVGWRSGRLADRLRRAGYTDVRNLSGGVFAWANEGRPLLRGGERVSVVHPYDATWGRFLRPAHRAD